MKIVHVNVAAYKEWLRDISGKGFLWLMPDDWNGTCKVNGYDNKDVQVQFINNEGNQTTFGATIPERFITNEPN